ncbi:hypothetical protein CC86DRAFT_436699 [Ophiobolus disseminans]|uniref:RING-type domain-containing protein n=1 Tax=Ophiobolus disseminans TaxID=1469910 RepID=A0A6A7A6W6_9PLEO|nr:hypothetical protein CC86DRAFT_436699 [Ophiobolus disseminans]
MSRDENGTFQCVDGGCLLWAVLALARLDAKLPSQDEALRLKHDHNDGFALRLRSTIDDIMLGFLDVTVLWDAEDSKSANRSVSELLRTATNYFQQLDSEFLHLHAIFKAFNSKIMASGAESQLRPAEPFAAGGMVSTIATQMLQLIAPSMVSFIDAFNQMSETLTQDPFEPLLYRFVLTRADPISRIIEEFIDTSYLHMMPEHAEIDSKLLVQVFQSTLVSKIRTGLTMLIRRRAPYRGTTIDIDGPMTKRDLEIFYRYITKMFGYASPLFEGFWARIVEPDSNHATDGSDYGMDDSDYNSDDEVYWQEYEPNNLVDVLAGPDLVSVHQVSHTIPGSPGKECVVCRDFLTQMHRIDICQHMYCEVCLDAQLHVHHESRYKCAMCRADFLLE